MSKFRSSLVILAVFFTAGLSSPTDSAAQTTQANGDWSNPSIWSTGIVPGVGDSVTIGHNVTVTQNTVVGKSEGQASAPAVTLNPFGNLSINSGVTLSVRGNVLLQNSPGANAASDLTLNAGSTLAMDASGATTPSSTRYRIQVGSDHFAPSARLNMLGTSGSRATILSVKTNNAANAYITDGEFIDGGLVTASYANLTNIGDAATPAITTGLRDAGTFTLANVVFANSGKLKTRYNLGQTAALSLDGVTFRGSLDLTAMELTALESRTTGTRKVTNSVFDKPVYFYGPVNFTITGNYFAEAFEIIDGPWDLFSGNLVRTSTADGTRLSNNVSDNYWLADGAGLINPHFVETLIYDRDTAIVGDIFEFTGSDANGDCVLVSLPNLPSTLSLINNIVLPNAAGESSCTLFSALGNDKSTIVAEHNTYFTGSQGAAVGETYDGRPGMLQSFRSNLAWDTTPRGLKLYDSGVNEAVQNLVAAASANYNGGFNLLTGSNGKGYDGLEFSAGLPGVNDVDANPQFFDPSRNIAKWDFALGGTGTVGGALSQLARRNDSSGYNSSYSVAGLLAYVRQGFAPTNTAFKGSAHDGADIGAISVVTATPVGTPPAPGVTPTATPVPPVSPTPVIPGLPVPTATAIPPVVPPTAAPVPVYSNRITSVRPGSLRKSSSSAVTLAFTDNLPATALRCVKLSLSGAPRGLSARGSISRNRLIVRPMKKNSRNRLVLSTWSGSRLTATLLPNCLKNAQGILADTDGDRVAGGKAQVYKVSIVSPRRR